MTCHITRQPSWTQIVFRQHLGSDEQGESDEPVIFCWNCSSDGLNPDDGIPMEVGSLMVGFLTSSPSMRVSAGYDRSACADAGNKHLGRGRGCSRRMLSATSGSVISVDRSLRSNRLDCPRCVMSSGDDALRVTHSATGQFDQGVSPTPRRRGYDRRSYPSRARDRASRLENGGSEHVPLDRPGIC